MFCGNCGARTEAGLRNCKECGTAAMGFVEAPNKRPMSMMERAAAAAALAQKQASLLAEAAVTCRECGAKPETNVFGKFCTQCGAKNPSAAAKAASVANGALKMLQKSMVYAADQLDGYAANQQGAAVDAQHGQGAAYPVPQAIAVQAPPQPQKPPPPQYQPPTPCPTCPECKGKGCSFCPAERAHQKAALGR